MAAVATRKPKLTAEQADAIHAQRVSVALSAGAGCGKTFVLTERFLAQLEAPGAELRDLVAITYTERAAREMRDRIRKKCLDRVQSATNPDEANRWWRLLRELDSARVSTIHAFCAALLRTHAVEAELDPGFQVLEEGSAGTLANEITDDLLRGWLGESRTEVLDLIVRFGLDGVRERLHSLSSGSPAALARWQDATVDDLLDTWQRFHAEKYVSAIVAELVASEPAQTVLRILAEMPGAKGKMGERRQTLLSLLPRLATSRDLAGDLLALHACARVAGRGIRQAFPPDGVIYEEFKNAAKELREWIDHCSKLREFDREAARPSAAAGLQLLSLALAVRAEYTAQKMRQGLLDFDDLIAHAHRLLTDPRNKKLQKRVADSIKLLLVDEFQDTDPVQVELVAALCGAALTQGKLFFVGDRKQSIYRFRGAAPVFRDLQDQMPAAGRLPLTKNFRSQPAILDFVNALFCERFANYEVLLADRPQVTPAPGVEFWWTQPRFAKKTAGNTALARTHEADFLGRRLRELFDSRQPLIANKDTGALRPLQYGDVCILFRALSDVQYYEQALQEHQIPYYLVGGHAFYAQQEIFDVLNLLRALDSTADTVALAGVLRSPFFALSDETLFWLAQRPGGLPDGLSAQPLPAQISPEQQARVAFAAQTLTALRAEKDRVPVAELLNRAIARTGYDALLLAEFLGSRKLANLRKLIDDARSMDQSGLFSLADFVMRLSDSIAEQPKESLAAMQAEGADVVRLMTIHQSKGLEFPFVVVADVDRPGKNSAPSAIFHAELGPLVRVKDAHGNDPTCIGLDMYNQLEQAENEAEIDRLLYVATTRAADRLALSSSLFGEPGSRWMKLLADRFDLATGLFQGELPKGSAIPGALVAPHPVAEVKPFSARRTKANWDQITEQAEFLAGRGAGYQPPHAAPIPPQRAARRQFSFSRFTASLRETNSPPNPYALAAARRLDPDTPLPLDPLGLGTLVHAALAELNFAEPQPIPNLVARHAALHVGGDAALSAEAARLIERLLATPKARDLAAATDRQVELEFLLAWPPDEFRFDGEFLHGFIDCLYQDAAGAWHLVDYKTNRVTPDNIAKIAAPYALQMGVYALAAETALGVSPASLTLCFLHAGLDFPLPWNAAARRRTIADVNRLLKNAS